VHGFEPTREAAMQRKPVTDAEDALPAPGAGTGMLNRHRARAHRCPHPDGCTEAILAAERPLDYSKGPTLAPGCGGSASLRNRWPARQSGRNVTVAGCCCYHRCRNAAPRRSVWAITIRQSRDYGCTRKPPLLTSPRPGLFLFRLAPPAFAHDAMKQALLITAALMWPLWERFL
jgi:hypothetical protein